MRLVVDGWFFLKEWHSMQLLLSFRMFKRNRPESHPFPNGHNDNQGKCATSTLLRQGFTTYPIPN